MLTNLLLDTAVTGLPYVLPFLGVLLVFRLLDRIDLTIDGSVALGAAVSATAVAAGVGPWTSILLAVLAGAAAGAATTLLHVLVRVPVLLAGIVMWIGSYSITLRVMGRPTTAVPSTTTIYAPLADLDRVVRDLGTIGVLVVIVTLVLVAAGLYLRTESGLALRATGVNTSMARSNGVDDRLVVGIGLATANAAAAAGGALVAHGQGFAEVNMGTGTLIAGIAAVLLGELLLRPSASAVGRTLVAVVVGAVLYRLVLLSALRMGLAASDLRLVTAATLAVALLAQRLRGAGARRPSSRDGRPRPVLSKEASHAGA